MPWPSLVLNPGDSIQIPLHYGLFDYGLHHLQLLPLAGGAVQLANLELGNGGIVTLVDIPEPAALSLMLWGLACCLYRRR
jgi:hypothetical protein